MIFHHTGSKDTYITNKIIGGVKRATDANVGYASTIDIFKLHNESTLKGSSGDLQEISRGLLYFDLTELRNSISNDVALDDSTLKIKLILSDVQGTQVAPENFTLQLYALKTDFDEGLGQNVTGLVDLDAANWAYSDSSTEWTTAGAFDGDETLIASQLFDSHENLSMDITSWVQSHWTDSVATPNYGFLLKLTSALETDSKSYFVKRFATRHSRNPFIRPKIQASWENYHIDERLHFEAGVENKISISHISKGEKSNLTTLPSLTLSYGTWSRTISDPDVAQVSLAGINQTGMYEATIAAIDVENADSALKTDLISSGSIVLQEEWKIGNQTFYSGSIKLLNNLSTDSMIQRDLRFNIIDLKSVYTSDETPKIRLFVRDRNLANEPVRIPIQLPSQIVHKSYYQIRDTNSLNVLIPFSDKLSTPDDSTRLSIDSQGMYFSFPASILPRGRTYTIDISYYDRGERRVFESNTAFRVQ